MSDSGKSNRRTFLMTAGWTSAVVAIGGGVGWLSSKYRGLTRKRKDSLFSGDHYTYDIDKYRKTDPALVLYKEVQQRDTHLKRVKAIAVGADDRVYVAGDQRIAILHDKTDPQHIDLPARPHALCVGPEGKTYVAFRRHVEIYDASGNVLAKHQTLSEKSWLTSIAVSDESIFLADGGNREIVRCDHDGDIIRHIGRITESPGFVVPSPYFDVVVAPDGMLKIANPGRLRIDTYSPEGEFISAWGKPSLAIDGFAGCCNPSNFTLLADGSFVTSEKGLNRVKVYNPNGVFRGVVAGVDHLIAEGSHSDDRVGFSMPVAADSRGQVYVLDPQNQSVRIFAPLAG